MLHRPGRGEDVHGSDDFGPTGRKTGNFVPTMSAVGVVMHLVHLAGFFIAAIANIRCPEAHEWLVPLATISLLQAAMGRAFFVLITDGGPDVAGLPYGWAPSSTGMFLVQ